MKGIVVVDDDDDDDAICWMLLGIIFSKYHLITMSSSCPFTLLPGCFCVCVCVGGHMSISLAGLQIEAANFVLHLLPPSSLSLSLSLEDC